MVRLIISYIDHTGQQQDFPMAVEPRPYSLDELEKLWQSIQESRDIIILNVDDNQKAFDSFVETMRQLNLLSL